MTEVEWLTGSNHRTLAEFVYWTASERKVRLFGCGCCRVVWDHVADDRSRRAVELTELVADGATAGEALDRAEFEAEAAYFALGEKRTRFADQMRHINDGWFDIQDLTELGSVRGPNGKDVPLDDAVEAAQAAEWVAGGHHATFLNRYSSPLWSAAILRDVFGNPFRPVAFDPNWRTDAAVSLARVMYDTRDFSATPILADALQDAGCDDEPILAHCRDAQLPHVRGCWVVDLVLGKS